MLGRIVIWGLAAFGAKTLYDRYESSVPKVKQTGRAALDRVARASDRVSRQAKGAVKDVTTHANTAAHELIDAASDVADLAQPAVQKGTETQPDDV